MFWGLNLKPNRKYSQATSKAFHISSAALDSSSAPEDGSNQVFISCDNQKFLICSLRKDVCEQVMLDLNFNKGEEICFQSIGNGTVSLCGYVIEDDPYDFMGEEEEGESADENVEAQEEDLRNKLIKAKKAQKEKGKASQSQDDEDSDDDEDDDLDGLIDGEAEDDDDDESDDDEEDNDDDDDDDEEEEDESDESDEEVAPPKAKQAKLEKAQKQQNGVAQKKVAATEAKGKKDKNKANQEKQGQQQKQKPEQKSGGERVLAGGVKIEDIRVGNGPEAKTGKRAQVYYEGRLKSNNKVFDSLKQGAGFKFGLGRGEVIKGWDVGVVGMKVGGKRRITCPPHMAYGARGSAPQIPPNSALVFEVELKGVN